MNNYIFKKADKDLFAVYQTIYSQADVEMWFDWNARLNDTKATDECYFIYQGEIKIGGVIMLPNKIMYPFMIPPFNDSEKFWELVLGRALELKTKDTIYLMGILSIDIKGLTNIGLKIWRKRQIMVCPTDQFRHSINENYYLETPNYIDISEIATVLRESFLNTISYDVFGIDSIEKVNENINKCFDFFTETNSLNQSVVVKEKETNKIVGGCIAGIFPNMPNNFVFIDEVFVLPEHRKRRLAEAMVKYTLTKANEVSQVVKLHVLVNNPARKLYEKLGFIAGPKFYDLMYKCEDNV